jgi:hypothetical protein
LLDIQRRVASRRATSSDKRFGPGKEEEEKEEEDKEE